MHQELRWAQGDTRVKGPQGRPEGQGAEPADGWVALKQIRDTDADWSKRKVLLVLLG